MPAAPSGKVAIFSFSLHICPRLGLHPLELSGRLGVLSTLSAALFPARRVPSGRTIQGAERRPSPPLSVRHTQPTRRPSGVRVAPPLRGALAGHSKLKNENTSSRDGWLGRDSEHPAYPDCLLSSEEDQCHGCTQDTDPQEGCAIQGARPCKDENACSSRTCKTEIDECSLTP